MFSQELLDLATRHQVYLERLKAGEIRRTSTLFADLDVRLARLLAQIRDADLGILTTLEAAALIEDVRKGQIEAYTEHLNKLTTMLVGVAQYSREFELESLDAVTIDEIEPDDGGANDLWPWILARPLSATGKLLVAWLGSWMGNEVTRGGDLVRRAIADGWTVSQLSTAFRGTRAGNYQDGLFGSSRRNTATTINTAIQHVSSAARVRTMEKTFFRPKGKAAPKMNEEGEVTSIPVKARKAFASAGIKVGDKIKLEAYRWASILDKVTSQICRSLDGQIFLFGQGPIPPAHPNCRSSIIAELFGKWLRRDKKGRFKARDPRTADGADGAEVVKGSSTYYEWLKHQPAAFQDDALGPTRAKLFREGGLSAAAFAKLNLGKFFQPLTLDEMRKLKPNAFRRAGI